MAGTNGKINNSQRAALVKVLENAYDCRLKKLEEDRDNALAEVTREVRNKLGVSKIDEELKELRARIGELESRKENLGFSKYNHNAMTGSDAHRMINEGINSEKKRIIQVTSEKDRNIAEIWTATELSEAKALVDAILQE